jgi:hypothetical protein
MSPVAGSAWFVFLTLAWLAPGLLAVLAFRPPARASSWIALSAPVAALVQMAVECARKLAGLEPDLWILGTVAVDLALFVAVVWKRRPVPFHTPADFRAAILLLGVPLVFAAAFAPAIFRKELTTDGVEALRMAISLDGWFLPRWPGESGLKGFGQGLIALAFPNAWFLRLTEFEGAGRFTFLMSLGVIACGVLALVDVREAGRRSWIAASAVGVAVLAAGATLGLNVSFDPYFADPANPAGPEVYAVSMMVAAFVAMHERRTGVFLAAAVLAHATLPSGLLFAVVLGAAWFLVTRSRTAIARAGAAIALCVLVTLLYEKVYVPHALAPGASLDSGSETIAGRMRLLTFTDFGRLPFLLLPCGIAPAVFLFFWKRQDAIGSIATLVTAAMFLFFFVLATYSPHYFAPAMVFALVPYWRWVASPKFAWIGLAGAVAGLALSLPRAIDVPEGYRDVARRVGIIGLPSLPNLDQDLREPAALLQRLAHYPWEDVDPRRQLVGNGLQLAIHSLASGPEAPASADWLAAPESMTPPGYEPVASRAGWVLLARSGTSLESIRDRGFATDFQARWYRVPRSALFRVYTERDRRYDLDLRALFGRSK